VARAYAGPGDQKNQPPPALVSYLISGLDCGVTAERKPPEPA
jgi:hypothetical protein